jgi:hypothetical protein
MTTLVALVPLVLGGANSASAAELDCGAMAASLNPGDHYQFKLEIQSKMVRLEKGDDFCSEPVKDWFKRQLILPPPAREEMPLPKMSPSQAQQDNTPLPSQQTQPGYVPDMGLETDIDVTPLPIAREFVRPKTQEEIAAEAAAAAAEETAETAAEGQQPGAPAGPAVKTLDHVTSDPDAAPTGAEGTAQDAQAYGVAAPPLPVSVDTMIKRCDRDLINFWSPGEHIIEGKKFWLSGVFTIDLDSDGRVDDVGFKIKAEGRIGNILNYFPSTEGRISGKTVDSLKLEDERDIHRLCPGNLTFERADPVAIAKQEKKFAANQVKAIAAAGGDKAAADEEAAPEEEEEEIEEPKKTTSNIILIFAAVAMVLLLAGGIGLALALRNITRSGKDEYDDDEDYDEDDDD